MSRETVGPAARASPQVWTWGGCRGGGGAYLLFWNHAKITPFSNAADKGYASADNIEKVKDAGAEPFIPFRVSDTGLTGGADRSGFFGRDAACTTRSRLGGLVVQSHVLHVSHVLTAILAAGAPRGGGRRPGFLPLDALVSATRQSR